MTPRSRIVWTLVGVTLSIGLSVVGTTMVFGLPQSTPPNPALHSLLETVGGLLAILIAGILLVEQQSSGDDREYFTWVSSGFAAMGVLDILHAAAASGSTAIWLQSLAVFVGGLTFSLVWSGTKWMPASMRRRLPWLMMFGAFLIGIASYFFPSVVPDVVDEHGFTRLAIGLNGAGGVGFFIAAAFFITRFHRNYDMTDWLFAIQTTLFGAVGLLMEMSEYWTLTWWWWHILRVIAYGSAFLVAVRSFLGVERKLIEVNRELRDVNLGLDQMVMSRTRELEQTNAQLNRDRFLLNTLVNRIPDAIFFKDRDGRFLKVNGAMAKDAGVSDPSEFVGKTDLDIWQGDLPKEAGEDERKILESGVPILNKEEQPVTSNGQPRWVLVTKMPLQDEAGEIVGTFGIAREITDQKLAEIQLRESEARFRLLVEHSPDASVTLDVDEGRFTDANLHAESLFKMPRDEIVKRHPVELSPEFQPSGVSSMELAEKMIKSALSGQRMVFDWVHCDAYGNQVPCEIRLVPLPFGDRKLLQATISDISARKQAEKELTDARDAAREANRELRRARDVAEDASRAKNDFLANVSHEIRTPMNAIIGMTDLVLDTELTSDQTDYLETVAESAESLMSIINQVLDFSKIESGQMPLEEIEFGLRDQIAASVKSLAIRAQAKRVELSSIVDPSVPDALIGDSVRLRQILVNLIGNAIKFTDDGEIAIEVHLRELSEEGAWLVFSVRDTGVGIPTDKLEVIFSAFEQADTSTTREYGGTGLGLAITSRLVAAMKGEMWVDSCPGIGSTFFFTIRMKLGSEPQSGTELRFDDVNIILVSEDTPDRKRCLEMLDAFPLSVVPVQTVSQAIAALRCAKEGRKRSVLIVDVDESSPHAFGVVRSIQESSDATGMPVILSTSGLRSGGIRRCEELGIHSQLVRPWKQSEVIRTIAQAVEETQGDHRDGDALSRVESEQEIMRPLSILLVEDGKANQTIAVGLLTKWGHCVDIVENGLEAVDAFKRRSFDAILMDVQMPQMDGLEATQRIRELETGSEKHVPIIAMTAHAMKGDRDRCLDAGMDDYVSKPVKKESLLKSLSKLCREPPKSRVAAPRLARVNNVDNSVIDWNAVAEILGGDRQLHRRVVSEAITRMQFLTPKLGEAIEKGESETGRRIARSIRDSAHAIVAVKTKKAASLIEEAVSESDFRAAKQAYGELESAVLVLEKAISDSNGASGPREG